MTQPSRPRSSRSRWWRAVPPLFLLAEVLVLIAVFQVIGWYVLLLLAGSFALGLVVLGNNSRRAMRDVRAMRATGARPQRTAGDAFFTLVAGVLLVFPGLLSSALALVLFLPPVRSIVRKSVGVAANRSVLGAMGIRVYPGAGSSLYGDVVRSETAQETPTYEQVPPPAIEGRIVDHGPR